MKTQTRDDVGQLADLGYDQQLKRDIGLFSVFAIGVATVAPVVGLYAIFSLGIQLTGPAWIWLLILSLAGQLTVAFVYSNWPRSSPSPADPITGRADWPASAMAWSPASSMRSP